MITTMITMMITVLMAAVMSVRARCIMRRDGLCSILLRSVHVFAGNTHCFVRVRAMGMRAMRVVVRVLMRVLMGVLMGVVV